MSRPQIFSIEKLGKARIEQLYELNNLPLPSFTNIKFLREDIILILDDEDEQNYNNSREVDRFFNDDVNHSNVDRVGNLDNDNIDNDNNNIDNDNLDNDNLDNDNLFNDNLDNDNLDNDNLDNDNLDYDNIDNDKIDNIDKVDNITSKDNDNDNENSQINEVVYDEHVASQFTNNFKWWSNNTINSKYPILSRIAFILLSLPLSSVESERLFSSAGRILTKDKCSTTDKKSNKVLQSMRNNNENIIFSADGKGLSFSKFKHLLLLVHETNVTATELLEEIKDNFGMGDSDELTELTKLGEYSNRSTSNNNNNINNNNNNTTNININNSNSSTNNQFNKFDSVNAASSPVIGKNQDFQSFNNNTHLSDNLTKFTKVIFDTCNYVFIVGSGSTPLTTTIVKEISIWVNPSIITPWDFVYGEINIHKHQHIPNTIINCFFR
ncbi:hypothetical protein ACTFIT_006897 [Dictyostelium discoideum]